MRCSTCQNDNPPGFRFCGHCRAPLPFACPSCKAELPAGYALRFCGYCGGDLVGSVALADRLDEEELRDVVQSYQRVCAEAVERYGGHVAQLMGDGLMAYFGYPAALEQDPQRAARAGLDIIPAVAALST